MSEPTKSHSTEKRSYYASGGSTIPIQRPVTAVPKTKELIEIDEKRDTLDALLQRPVSRNDLLLMNYDLDMDIEQRIADEVERARKKAEQEAKRQAEEMLRKKEEEIQRKKDEERARLKAAEQVNHLKIGQLKSNILILKQLYSKLKN